ncbi:MAG: glycosyltransferase [Prevotella sp.]|nr:glycosyltransferase [Prevotella sp.]
MRVLHFYPDKADMVTRYVDMLVLAMGEYAGTDKACTLSDFKKKVKTWHPDIVHLHGCWNSTAASAASYALKKDIRYVLSPHGQLESWIIGQNYWRDKLPKIVAFQRRTIRRAYAIVAMGRMEAGSIGQLGWNRRIEIVHNPLITSTVDEREAGLAVHSIYRKVLDSNVYPLMKADTVIALRALIKAGQTRNERWLDDIEYSAVKELDKDEWRKILLYAYHEKILDTIQSGISTLNMPAPDISLPDIPVYLPHKKAATARLLRSTGHGINADVAAMLHETRKRISDHTITISDLLELSQILRRPDIEDNKVINILELSGQTKHAGRMMQVLADMTGLEEGFMPVPAVKDRQIKKIKKTIIKHLEI